MVLIPNTYGLKVDITFRKNAYLKLNGLKVDITSRMNVYLKLSGLKWTRTTDLTLIRRAL